MNFLRSSKRVSILLIFLLFLALRLPGLHLPYYQDERIWYGIQSFSDIPHPPLTAGIFLTAIKIFGPDNLRLVPFFLAIANFWLLFCLVRYKFSHRAACWAAAIFTGCYYSVLASLMVDTDGQVLPFFFLLSALSYFKWQQGGLHARRWASLLGLCLVLGCLVKLSFVIVIGTILLDYLYTKKSSLVSNDTAKYLGLLGLFGIGLGILIFAFQFIIPSFNIPKIVDHMRPYFSLSERNYFQTLIQTLKALFYLSPLVVLPTIFISKKLRFFYLFILLGLIFYLAIFDFSSGALDRYLQFLIVPLSIVSGVIINDLLAPGSFRFKHLLPSLGLAIPIFFMQYVSHATPALYPKTEWFARVVGLKWNFLFPFTGGSGPMGFYISWLFIATIWAVSGIILIYVIWKKRWLPYLLTSLLVLGILYNAVFIEEYLFGKINGSSTVLLEQTVEHIRNTPNIKKVISYNNIGNYELSNMGKFERRLYVAPKFESDYVSIINSFTGHYLVIDIPKISSGSPYTRYFSNCVVIFEEHSKKISSKIYDCKKVKFRQD